MVVIDINRTGLMGNAMSHVTEDQKIVGYINDTQELATPYLRPIKRDERRRYTARPSN